jgi:hypothetical protein
MKRLMIGFLIIFLIGIAFAGPVENILHLNIQSTYPNGDIQTGTFNFTFNISNSSDCSKVVYTNYSNLTTDNRGVISYYLENLSFDYSVQYWLCIYRDGVLKYQDKMARVPYALYANNTEFLGGKNSSYFLNTSGVEDYFTRGINVTFENITAENMSLSGGLYFISSFIDNLVSGIIRIFGSLRVEGTMNASGMIYYNNGTPITSLNETDIISGITNASLNQRLNLTINQYLLAANASYLSTYNATYAGLIDNASYLSTYNVSYASFNTTANIQNLYNVTAGAIANLSLNQMLNLTINQYLLAANSSYLSTYNATYAGLMNNASYLSTYNATYAGLIDNASYLSTYNASYASFNTTANIQNLYNVTAGAIANLSLNQMLNLTINQYLLAANSSYLSTYNATYAGLIDNASYLSTYNASYASFNFTANIQNLYNVTAGAIANLSLNQMLNLTINQYLLAANSSYLSTYNATYAGLIDNASYLSTYNASYASFNFTANIQSLINNTNMQFANISFQGGGYIKDNGTTLILGHS